MFIIKFIFKHSSDCNAQSKNAYDTSIFFSLLFYYFNSSVHRHVYWTVSSSCKKFISLRECHSKISPLNNLLLSQVIDFYCQFIFHHRIEKHDNEKLDENGSMYLRYSCNIILRHRSCMHNGGRWCRDAFLRYRCTMHSYYNDNLSLCKPNDPETFLLCQWCQKSLLLIQIYHAKQIYRVIKFYIFQCQYVGLIILILKLFV